jgi:hypothetical protein
MKTRSLNELSNVELTAVVAGVTFLALVCWSWSLIAPVIWAVATVGRSIGHRIRAWRANRLMSRQ